ncbi:MAG: RNA polymerase sigma factor [Acidimicrobiales bacterium]
MAVTQDFEAFYRAEQLGARKIGFTLLGNWEDAEDVAQEAFLTLSRRWDTVGGYDSPRAWLHNVICNRARSVGRRRAVRARKRHLVETDRSWTAPAATELLAEYAEVVRAVCTLPMRERCVVGLWMCGFPERDIAEALHLSLAEVKRRRARAKVKLSGMLGEALVEDDE